MNKRAPNEAGPLIRIVSLFLCFICWSLFTTLIYKYIYTDGILNFPWVGFIATFSIGIVTFYLAVRGFVPPWLASMIPYFRSGTNGEELRRK